MSADGREKSYESAECFYLIQELCPSLENLLSEPRRTSFDVKLQRIHHTAFQFGWKWLGYRLMGMKGPKRWQFELAARILIFYSIYCFTIGIFLYSRILILQRIRQILPRRDLSSSFFNLVLYPHHSPEPGPKITDMLVCTPLTLHDFASPLSQALKNSNSASLTNRYHSPFHALSALEQQRP
jgi:hypothetical protein